MLTGELRSQIDAIWNAFWSGGISNLLEVIEQTTYLLYIRRLDDKRQPLLPPEKLGAEPKEALTDADQARNNLTDLLARWYSHKNVGRISPQGVTRHRMAPPTRAPHRRATTQSHPCPCRVTLR
jgi:hypothetical protein